MPDLIGLKAKLIAGGIILAVALAIFGAQQWRISERDKTIIAKDAMISTLTGSLAVSEANVAVLKGQVDRQNRAVQRLKVEKAALDAKVGKEALEAKKNRVESLSTEGSGVDMMNQFFERLYK